MVRTREAALDARYHGAFGDDFADAVGLREGSRKSGDAVSIRIAWTHPDLDFGRIGIDTRVEGQVAPEGRAFLAQDILG